MKHIFAILVFLSVVEVAHARDRILIVGSSTVYPFSTVVAEQFGAKGRFKTPVIESTGTGGGLKLFCSGVGEAHPDIANASRRIKKSEISLCRKNGVEDVVEVVIGNDGIVFANAAKGLKSNFTKSQLWQAMAAKGNKPKRWNEIDSSLADIPIRVLVPPPTSGTRDAWGSLVMKAGCPKKIKESNSKDCELLREDGVIVEAGENDALIVQKLSADPTAYGIFGFNYLDNNRDKIQSAKIDGVDISLKAIQDNSYPLSRPLYFYLKKAHIGVIPGIAEYLQEYTSQDSMGTEGYLSEIGLVPLGQKKFADVKRAVLEGIN